jgi:hypothetical protein
MFECRDNAGANPAANLKDLVGPSSNFQDIRAFFLQGPRFAGFGM